MANIHVMDRKEMRKMKNALHIDIKDGKLHVWGNVVEGQDVCIYPEEFSMFDSQSPHLIRNSLQLDSICGIR